MALAPDSSSTVRGVSVSSISWSHTCTGSNRYLAAFSSIYQIGTETTSSITYNSTAMTDKGSIDNGAVNINGRELVAPATGSNTVAVTLSDGCLGIVAGAMSFTDTHQSVPSGTAVTATGNSTTPSATVSSAATEYVIGTGSIGNANGVSLGADQSFGWSDIDTGGWHSSAGSYETGAASTTHSYSGTSGVWSIIAWAVKPVSATSTPRHFLLLGVGS